MNDSEYTLWSRITFRTTEYAKNFDLINKHESFISEYTGTISEINISEQLPPTVVGEYGYSIWNIGLAKEFKFDISKLMKKYRFEDGYSEILKLKSDGVHDFSKIKTLVILHQLVLHPNYKKKEVVQEFIEHIYRAYYSDDVTILALFKPIQDNEIDYDYFYNHNIVRIKKDLFGPDGYTDIKASDYYQLNDLKLKTDLETNELKLFSLASKLGFSRIADSHMFVFSSDRIINRMKNKFEHVAELNKITHGK